MPGLDFFSVFIIALALSADCFAVALCSSIASKALSRGQVFRVAGAFGLAQAVMPVLGWLAGRTVVDLISAYDHWIAFGLLAFIGGRMIWESIHDKNEHRNTDISRGWPLFTLALATSIDSLAVGLSFALLEVNMAMASPTIGLVAFTITGVGFVLGRKAGEILGRRAETMGGIILIGIGIRILVSHLMGG